MLLRKFYRKIVYIVRSSKAYVIIIIFFIFALIYTILKQYKNVDVDYGPTPTLMYYKNRDATSPREVLSKSELHIQLLKAKVERIAQKVKSSRIFILNTKPIFEPNYNLHIFYYAWYRNQEVDGHYKHWNHSYLPNWKDKQTYYTLGSHEPIIDIGSNFYPSLGCYSSRDPSVIEVHMKQLRDIGVGVIALSWTPPTYQDSPNKLLPLLFQYAARYKIKIALHIEPYYDRNPINLIEYLQKFIVQYRNHDALYTIKKAEKELPVFYIYDSYLIPAVAWMEVLSTKGRLSIRGSEIDAVFIGLLVDIQHRYHIKKSHFDGFYTYFAANGFSYGSTWKNWKSLSKFALQNRLIFIPSVAPGYIDTQVRPWNYKNARHRRHGQYYDVAWRTAINSNVNYISITSFNEWHEGTQIEPAIPKRAPGFLYLDYEPDGSRFYLNLTKWWNEQFCKALARY